MRGFKRSPRLFGLGVLLAIPVLFGGQAGAEVHTDQGGSLIIFPKVVADGERDTVIKITNTKNLPATAHCFYTNALGRCSVSDETCLASSDCPVLDETCDAPCPETNFDIALTPQQPTFWRVSTGRFADITLAPCQFNNTCSCVVDGNSGALNCPGFPPSLNGGLNSIAIPRPGTDFVGELRCYLTDATDNLTPVGQNSLIGEAIITTLDSGEQSQYNAITVSSPSQGLNDDLDLLLNDEEYNACADSLVFTHYGADGSELASGATVNTELTLAPCTMLYSAAVPGSATVSYRVTDQLESTLSADARRVDCHLTRDLAEISNIFDATMESNLFKTRILVDASLVCLTGDNAGDECEDDGDCTGAILGYGCRASSGVVGVAEEFYSDSSRDTGSSAWSLTNEGNRASDGGDVIGVPEP